MINDTLTIKCNYLKRTDFARDKLKLEEKFQKLNFGDIELGNTWIVCSSLNKYIEINKSGFVNLMFFDIDLKHESEFGYYLYIKNSVITLINKVYNDYPHSITVRLDFESPNIAEDSEIKFNNLLGKFQDFKINFINVIRINALNGSYTAIEATDTRNQSHGVSSSYFERQDSIVSLAESYFPESNNSSIDPTISRSSFDNL